ncbi:MAG: hypothetical protein QXN96_02715 [Candidatus Bathyarchaeia archaeon]
MREVIAEYYGTLEYVYEELKAELPEELQSMPYETIAMEEVIIRKKGKVYKYIHLKGYRYGKTKTIKSYPMEEADTKELQRLVNLYRTVKHFSKALDYMHMLNIDF